MLQVTLAEAEDRPLVLSDQDIERGPIAGAGALDQLPILVLRDGPIELEGEPHEPTDTRRGRK
jgi:hypothetical protein